MDITIQVMEYPAGGGPLVETARLRLDEITHYYTVLVSLGNRTIDIRKMEQERQELIEENRELIKQLEEVRAEQVIDRKFIADEIANAKAPLNQMIEDYKMRFENLQQIIEKYQIEMWGPKPFKAETGAGPDKIVANELPPIPADFDPPDWVPQTVPGKLKKIEARMEALDRRIQQLYDEWEDENGHPS